MEGKPLEELNSIMNNDENTSMVRYNCLKRKVKDIPEDNKKMKVSYDYNNKVGKSNINDEDRENTKDGRTHLLFFPDDILLMIISNLNHHCIINLSKTCNRLYEVCQDHTLWREVHFCDNIATHTEMAIILKYITAETKSIHTKGYYRSGDSNKETLTLDWLTQITEKCPNLLSLSLPNHYIDCECINIQHFPKTLTKLDLSNTFVKNAPWNKSYFKDLCSIMPDLEVLILSNCHWFEPHSLMALSKCPKLNELRLDGCIKIKDCVAYCGLATRGGFKSLKTLDLRKCPIGSSELTCFASVPSIVNLYLESPNIHGISPGIAIDTPIMILFTNEPVVEIRADGHRGKVTCPRLKIEKLFVRNYKRMTDMSLHQLARDATFLKYLDVSGSGVTAGGIEKFRTLRPNVTLVNNSL
ncbi:hypothetical protein RUM44_004568 [Polyplax serrata]|uniref:F-box domain-containing protein n=1 Tax=Polyplax serrata TaxID=468196 RepID=A0ABR1B3Y4_POLSC